jgi:hypothetical protein
VGTAALLIFLAVMVGIAALALLTSVVGPARLLAPPLSVTLAVALGLRLAVMAVAFHRTPYDVALWFRSTGEAVLQHQDPLLVLPRYEWNFLPAMPYVHALELSTGLPWEIAGKLCPLLADLVTTVLVGTLAAPERAHGSAGSTRCIPCPSSWSPGTGRSRRPRSRWALPPSGPPAGEGPASVASCSGWRRR